MTSLIGVHEGYDNMSSDVSNDFIQTEMPDGNEWMIMKIIGVLV